MSLAFSDDPVALSVAETARSLFASWVCPHGGKCDHRRRSSFGWVLQVCGLCMTDHREAQSASVKAKDGDHRGRFLRGDPLSRGSGVGWTIGYPGALVDRVVDLGFTGVNGMNWVPKYLATGGPGGGPLVVPFGVLSGYFRSEGTFFVPGYAERLLSGGSLASTAATQLTGRAVAWPAVYRRLAVDLELRQAVMTVFALQQAEHDDARGRITPGVGNALAELLLAADDGTFLKDKPVTKRRRS